MIGFLAYSLESFAVSKYHFEKFTPETAQASRLAWEKEAQDGKAFVTEIQRLFDWVDTHHEISNHDSAAFGIFDKKNQEAVGICEITIQRRTVRSKWVKMLRLHLRPSVELELQSGNSDNAMDIFVESMQGSILLQLTHQANTLKVYGRTNEQLNFLKALVVRLQSQLEESDTVKASIEGRFLSINVSAPKESS